MRVARLVGLAWVGAVVANYRAVEVYPGDDDTGVALSGNWKAISDNCGSALVTSTVGDSLTYSFQGSAVYVFGTVACGWPGILNLSVDGTFNTTINRCNCDAVPTGGPGYVCRYPWLMRDGLDPNAMHTLSVTLVGPTLADDPSGNVIAELRSIKYLIPLDPTDQNSSTTEVSPTSTVTSVVLVPTATVESADAPLPELKSLHLSTAATCGIIIAVVILFLLGLLICILLRRRSQQKRRRMMMEEQQHQRTMTSRPGSMISARMTRYPTEHLAWSPAAEKLEAHAQQKAASRSRRNSAGSAGRSSWRGSRPMDVIPEADLEHDHHIGEIGSSTPGTMTPGSVSSLDEDKAGGFSWASSSENDLMRRESVAVPSLTATGDYWNRRTSGSGRLPQSPLRRSLIPSQD